MESPICPAGTCLIETLKWDGTKLVRRDRHLARLHTSAIALGYDAGEDAVARALASVGGAAPLRVRLALDRNGKAEVTTIPLAASAPEWRIMLSPERLSSSDPLLRHKTSHRPLYDRIRAALPAGIDEVIFANERDEICEGTITTVFFDIGQGLATPPLGCGCLPGILRAEMLDSGTCYEAILHIRDLNRAKLWVGNALRGLIPAHLGNLA